MVAPSELSPPKDIVEYLGPTCFERSRARLEAETRMLGDVWRELPRGVLVEIEIPESKNGPGSVVTLPFPADSEALRQLGVSNNSSVHLNLTINHKICGVPRRAQLSVGGKKFEAVLSPDTQQWLGTMVKNEPKREGVKEGVVAYGWSRKNNDPALISLVIADLFPVPEAVRGKLLEACQQILENRAVVMRGKLVDQYMVSTARGREEFMVGLWEYPDGKYCAEWVNGSGGVISLRPVAAEIAERPYEKPMVTLSRTKTLDYSRAGNPWDVFE